MSHQSGNQIVHCLPFQLHDESTQVGPDYWPELHLSKAMLQLEAIFLHRRHYFVLEVLDGNTEVYVLAVSDDATLAKPPWKTRPRDRPRSYGFDDTSTMQKLMFSLRKFHRGTLFL